MAAVTAHSAVFVAAADSFALPSKKKTPGVGSRRAPCSVSRKRTDTLARSWRPPTATSKIPQEGRGVRGDLCARGMRETEPSGFCRSPELGKASAPSLFCSRPVDLLCSWAAYVSRAGPASETRRQAPRAGMPREAAESGNAGGQGEGAVCSTHAQLKQFMMSMVQYPHPAAL